MNAGYDISVSISGQSRAEKALRFLSHEAALCRDRDTAEALCLLLPALLSELDLKPMNQFEALDFLCELREALTNNPKKRGNYTAGAASDGGVIHNPKKRGPRHAMATAQTETTYDEQKLPHNS